VTLSVIDFMRESSKFIHKDRPDLYNSEAAALEKILQAMDAMRETPGSGLTSFGDYMLIRYQDDEVDEWDLVRRISSVLSFHDEDRTWIASHTLESQALKFGVDLPSPDDFDPEEED
jgi:hypothetical protein